MTDEVVVPFDKARKRRYTKATASKDEEFVTTSLRVPARDLQRMDEICAARVDSALKTKSDIINDAIHTWMEVFFSEHGGDLPRLNDRFILDNVARIRDARAKDLETITVALEEATREGNRPLLGVVFFNIVRFQSEVSADDLSSPAQKKQADDLAEKTKAAIEKYEKEGR